MSGFAARMFDSTAHGGKVMGGWPNVIIGGMPAARIGDPHLCPMTDGPKPHVGGVVVTASATVIIGGAFAARVGDLCGCPSAGKVGAGAPAVAGASSKGTIGSGSGPTAKYKISDQNKDGTPDTIDASAHVVDEKGGKDLKLGGVTLGGYEHKKKGLYGEAQYRSRRGDYGASKKGKIEFGVAKESLKLYAGGDAKDHAASVMGEYDFLHVEGAGDYLVGDDGERIGLGVEGKLGAEVLAGKAVVTTKVDAFGILDHFGLSMEASTEAGGDIVSAGLGAGAQAFYNRKDERLHLGIMGKLAVAAGLKGNLKLSIGKKAKAGSGSAGAGAGGIPNPIIMGEFTVIIGP